MLWVVFLYINPLLAIFLAPLFIVGGAYIAILKAKNENEKWHLIANALSAYGMSAASVSALLFLGFFGPALWGILFEINGYVAAVGGLSIITLALWVGSYAAYFYIGLAAALIRKRLKKS